MYLLDTNVVSELRKSASGRADPNVIHWASNVPANKQYLSVMSLLEIEMGILLIESKDKPQAKRLRDWLNNKVLPTFTGRILSIDQNTALRCAKLHVPNPKPDRDALIAATALEHNMVVVTRNVKDFSSIGVEIINPWNDEA